MRRLLSGVTAIALVISPVAIAQPDNHHNRQQEDQRGDNQRRGSQPYANDRNAENGRHHGWTRDRGDHHRWGRGQRMGYNDWSNARRIDYRRYNLRQPPRGYEWRQLDDRYVLAALANGLIISVILSNRNVDNGRHLGWSKDRGDHYRWGRGQRMGYNDWNHARRIDHRHYNLRPPPGGYEWRRNDDRFILVGVATGLIISVILSNGR